MLATRRSRAGLATCIGALLAFAPPLQAQNRIEFGGHVLRRTSYGATTPGLLSLMHPDPAVQGVLIDNYIDAQLLAAATDPSPVIPGVQLLPANKIQDPPASDLDWDIDNLARHNLALALYSENQLRELMVGFWQQHFNTSHGTVSFRLKKSLNVPNAEADRLAAYFEYKQNEGFRANALGDFRDLLEVSGEGLAMLIYLDSFNSKKASPNDNYARELMELHTLGTDNEGNANLFNQDDVEEVAKIFTGWAVVQNASNEWVFQFDPSEHATGDKFLFEDPNAPTPTYLLTIPSDPATPGEGRAFFDFLAGSEVTADYVCRKLYNFFLSQDDVDESLIGQCKTAWGARGDISAVLGVLLKSQRMKDATDMLDLVERPIEALTSTVRSLDGSVTTLAELDFLYERLNGRMAQSLFRFPSPDGYSFENFDQISTSQVLYRTQVQAWIESLYVTGSPVYSPRVVYNWGTLFNNYSFNLIDPTSESDMVIWFFLLIHQGLPDPTSGSPELADALAYVTTDDNGLPHQFNFAQLLSGPNADIFEYLRRVDSLVRYLTSLPRSLQK